MIFGERCNIPSVYRFGIYGLNKNFYYPRNLDNGKRELQTKMRQIIQPDRLYFGLSLVWRITNRKMANSYLRSIKSQFSMPFNIKDYTTTTVQKTGMESKKGEIFKKSKKSELYK